VLQNFRTIKDNKKAATSSTEVAAFRFILIQVTVQRHTALESDEWPRQPHFCAVKKQPHAQRFRPLHNHQSHVPANMVSIGQRTGLQLIVLGIALEAANPFFYSAAKPGTDFETLVGYAIGDHGGYLEAGIPEDGKIIQCRAQVFPACADTRERQPRAPDYGR
jgi:hypothetical protein